jgi:hypothetical protein
MQLAPTQLEEVFGEASVTVASKDWLGCNDLTTSTNNLPSHIHNTDIMSTKTKETSEGDVIVARALSSYAQLRANIAKWSGLPAGSVSTTAEPENEDEELFTAESET